MFILFPFDIYLLTHKHSFEHVWVSFFFFFYVYTFQWETKWKKRIFFFEKKERIEIEFLIKFRMRMLLRNMVGRMWTCKQKIYLHAHVCVCVFVNRNEVLYKYFIHVEASKYRLSAHLQYTIFSAVHTVGMCKGEKKGYNKNMLEHY